MGRVWCPDGKQSDLSLPAFISSAHGASSGVSALLPSMQLPEYQELKEAEDEWSKFMDDTDLNNNALQPTMKSVQALWYEPIVKRTTTISSTNRQSQQKEPA